jgi:hypothetical protein
MEVAIKNNKMIESKGIASKGIASKEITMARIIRMLHTA